MESQTPKAGAHCVPSVLETELSLNPDRVFDDGACDHLHGWPLSSMACQLVGLDKWDERKRVLLFCCPYTWKRGPEADSSLLDPHPDLPTLIASLESVKTRAEEHHIEIKGLNIAFGLGDLLMHTVSVTGNLPFVEDSRGQLLEELSLDRLFGQANHAGVLGLPAETLRPKDSPLLMLVLSHGRVEKVFYPLARPQLAGESLLHWLSETKRRSHLGSPISPPARQSSLPITWTRAGYVLSNDAARMKAAAVKELLMQSHWAQSRTEALIQDSLENSDCYGVYTDDDRGTLVAMARVITDRSTFAYLCDVLVDQSHQGRGLARWLLDAIMSNPWVNTLRRFVLFSRDAQGLYRKYGFEKPAAEELDRIMTLLKP